MSDRDDGPRGPLARYAYGYTDKKPGWPFWAFHAIAVVATGYVLWRDMPK